MTKEELEKEIEEKGVEYADKQKRIISVHEDSGYSWGQVEEAYEKGALDFAEPREKCIEEQKVTIEKLKKENELFKKANEIIAQQRDDRDADISILENQIEELEEQLAGQRSKESQLEKMKSLLKEIYEEYDFCELVKIRNDLPTEIQEVLRT